MTATIDTTTDVGAVAPVTTPKRAGRSRSRLTTWCAATWLIVIAIAALLADFLPLLDPNETEPRIALESPSWSHPLGTDGLGRDQFSRIIHGAQVSLSVSITAVAIGVIAGGILGLLAGYFRGRFEGVVLAVNDVVLAFPGLILLLVLLAYVGRSLLAISLIIGVLSIPLYTRVARANTLSVTEHDYVRAARILGSGRRRILQREILPNIVLPVSSYAFVALGRVIVLEGSLAFLGLSVQPPDPTWGQMIADSKQHLNDTYWPAIGPSAAMFFTVLSLSLIGDRMRHRIDVRGDTL